MSPLEALLVLVAGVWAGAINTLVGSGSLVTFPVLLAVGYSPLTANVSNNLGVVPGSISGAYGYRRELRGQRGRLLRFAPFSALGGLAGAVLLLALPASAFEAIVPAFVALGVVLVLVQPRINRRLAQRRAVGAEARATHGGAPALAATGLTGVYGGYFGAAQGILLLAILGIAIDDDLQRVNALKVVLAGLVNFVAAIVFVIAAHVAWGAVALIAVGSAVGGQLGARIGRRLPAPALRAVIVVVGLAAIAKLLLD
ncbi:MAG: sulfite exporter TauE/SafE family protein [Conexibacter sp.]